MVRQSEQSLLHRAVEQFPLISGELPSSFTHIRSLISSGGSSNKQAPAEDLLFFREEESSSTSMQCNQINSFQLSLILSNNLLVGSIFFLVNLHVLLGP